MNLDKLKDPYVIILIGPPLSGKTTWINKNFEPGSFELISRDQIVLDIHGEDDYNTAFNTVDQKEVDRVKELAAAGITSIPTMNLFVNGEIVKTIVGARPKPAIMKELEGFI